MTVPSGAACQTCEYCQRGQQPKCRKEPPRPDENGRAFWPIVRETDWCGSYEASGA